MTGESSSAVHVMHDACRKFPGINNTTAQVKNAHLSCLRQDNLCSSLLCALGESSDLSICQGNLCLGVSLCKGGFTHWCVATGVEGDFTLVCCYRCGVSAGVMFCGLSAGVMFCFVHNNTPQAAIHLNVCLAVKHTCLFQEQGRQEGSSCVQGKVCASRCTSHAAVKTLQLDKPVHSFR